MFNPSLRSDQGTTTVAEAGLRPGLVVGPIVLESPVILAPMSGVSDLPFRNLVKSCRSDGYGAGLVVSEMIASVAMVRENAKTLQMASHEPEEHPMAVQLAGCDPATMAAAARLNQDRGAAIIDINMGCPVKKVVNGEAGSALMRDEDRAIAIIAATVKAVEIPVTLKMRTGWDDRTRNAPSLAARAEAEGIKMITVHGRTRCQFYRGQADWEFIRQVKNSVKIPVIVNGDITSFAQASLALSQSGADGVMVGRGSYGRPWFPAQLARYLATGELGREPLRHELYDLVARHFAAMLSHYGTDTGVRMARKHLAWYSKGLPGSAEFRAAVNQMSDPLAVTESLKRFFSEDFVAPDSDDHEDDDWATAEGASGDKGCQTDFRSQAAAKTADSAGWLDTVLDASFAELFCRPRRPDLGAATPPADHRGGGAGLDPPDPGRGAGKSGQGGEDSGA